MCNYLERETNKLEGMTDAQFVEIDEIVQADILLDLEDKISYNVKITNTTVKKL